MAVLVGVILVGGVLAVVGNFTTKVDHTAKSSGVWDPVHGHYH